MCASHGGLMCLHNTWIATLSSLSIDIKYLSTTVADPCTQVSATALTVWWSGLGIWLTLGGVALQSFSNSFVQSEIYSIVVYQCMTEQRTSGFIILFFPWTRYVFIRETGLTWKYYIYSIFQFSIIICPHGKKIILLTSTITLFKGNRFTIFCPPRKT